MRLGTRKRPTAAPARPAFRWPDDGKIVLHVGCGPIGATPLPDMFDPDDWHEVRLDIDPGVDPDVVGTITGMDDVASESVDAVWSSHNLEHVHPHEVPLALAEFLRVLRPGGTAYVQVPDLEVPARAILKGRLDVKLYDSPAGPVTPLDMLYGYGPAIARGEHYMAHNGGFTRHTLARRLDEAGFASVNVVSKNHALWATATRSRKH
jgi:SAM-dependent methyltransferase